MKSTRQPERFPPTDIVVTALLAMLLAVTWLCLDLAHELSFKAGCICTTTDGGPSP
jgi:hypothetical protein